MQTRRTLTPGQKGTKKLREQYGAKLIYVRYRCDAVRHRRYKTVELIVEEAPWTPPTKLAGETIVGLRVTFQEVELQRRVKRAGGKWNPELRLWEMRYEQAVALGLEDRIERPKVSISRNQRGVY